MTEYKRIAIVKLSAIGDIIHALPVASALRKRYPKAHIAWIVEGKGRELLEGNTDLDEYIVFNKARWSREFPYPHRTIPVLWEIWRFGHRLRKEKFDLASDLQGLMKSGLLTWLTGANTRIGFSKNHCRESVNVWFTNCHITPSPKDTHIIDQCLSLIRGLGADTEYKHFKIHVAKEDHEYIEQFLHKKNIPRNIPLVLIHPGAGWETKRWGGRNYAQLADLIVSELEGVPIFLWGPTELTLVKDIQKNMDYPSFRACPTTLKQSLALMQKAHLFLAGDTGPLHMAAALNIPCVGIYGPSSPERNGPYGKIHQVVQTDAPCRHCFQRFCKSKECMNSITVEKVMDKVRKIW